MITEEEFKNLVPGESVLIFPNGNKFMFACNDGENVIYKNIIVNLGRVTYDWMPAYYIKENCHLEKPAPRTKEITLQAYWDNESAGLDFFPVSSDLQDTHWKKLTSDIRFNGDGTIGVTIEE